MSTRKAKIETVTENYFKRCLLCVVSLNTNMNLESARKNTAKSLQPLYPIPDTYERYGSALSLFKSFCEEYWNDLKIEAKIQGMPQEANLMLLVDDRGGYVIQRERLGSIFKRRINDTCTEWENEGWDDEPLHFKLTKSNEKHAHLLF